MDELQPCPFCGAEGDINYNYDKKFAPYCINNDCFLNELDYGFETEQEAIDAWNKRANVSKINERGIIHGHWIGQPISGYADCKCSVCGAVCNVHACAGIPTQKYCYRCGALMLEDK